MTAVFSNQARYSGTPLAGEPSVQFTLADFLAIGRKNGELRGRIGWLECQVEQLSRENDRLRSVLRRCVGAQEAE